MSNFLFNLVRRGAGLASPAAVQPDTPPTGDFDAETDSLTVETELRTSPPSMHQEPTMPPPEQPPRDQVQPSEAASATDSNAPGRHESTMRSSAKSSGAAIEKEEPGSLHPPARGPVREPPQTRTTRPRRARGRRPSPAERTTASPSENRSQHLTEPPLDDTVSTEILPAREQPDSSESSITVVTPAVSPPPVSRHPPAPVIQRSAEPVEPSLTAAPEAQTGAIEPVVQASKITPEPTAPTHGQEAAVSRRRGIAERHPSAPPAGQTITPVDQRVETVVEPLNLSPSFPIPGKPAASRVGPPDVHINIGTLEMQGPGQPPAPPPQIKPQGFGEYTSLRTYTGWERS